VGLSSFERTNDLPHLILISYLFGIKKGFENLSRIENSRLTCGFKESESLKFDFLTLTRCQYDSRIKRQIKVTLQVATGKFFNEKDYH
jgi:hypothetical protein